MVTIFKIFNWCAHAKNNYGKAKYFFPKYFSYFKFGHLFLSIFKILIYFLRIFIGIIDYFKYLT